MTQNSAPWEGVGIGDAANAPYSSAEWSHFWALRHGVIESLYPNYGVLPGSNGTSYPPLFVSAAGALNINVNIGAALVNGKLFETDTAITLTVGGNASGNPRIDTVVLRADYVAQTIRAVVRQGSPAGSPVPPSLTQSASLWETPLANIAVINGVSTIAQADITDRRRVAGTTGAGWLPYAYPVNVNPIDPYTGAYILAAGFAIAMPIQLAGNMLVEQLATIGRGNNSPVVTWGIYVQDTNDGVAGEKVVRRIGGRETVSTTSVSSGNRATFPAIPAPFALAPGAYWLVVKAGSANFTFGMFTAAASSFNSGVHNLMINTAAPTPLGQTLDLSAAGGWVFAADTDDSYAFRLEGRVLGLTTAF